MRFLNDQVLSTNFVINFIIFVYDLWFIFHIFVFHFLCLFSRPGCLFICINLNEPIITNCFAKSVKFSNMFCFFHTEMCFCIDFFDFRLLKLCRLFIEQLKLHWVIAKLWSNNMILILIFHVFSLFKNHLKVTFLNWIERIFSRQKWFDCVKSLHFSLIHSTWFYCVKH